MGAILPRSLGSEGARSSSRRSRVRSGAVAELEPATESSDSAHVESVRKYYDANTERFVRHGQGKASIKAGALAYRVLVFEARR